MQQRIEIPHHEDGGVRIGLSEITNHAKNRDQIDTICKGAFRRLLYRGAFCLGI